MNIKRISTLHKTGDPVNLFHRNGDIYLYPTVAYECGVEIGEVFILDDVVCKFRGHKKVGLIFPKIYDVYAFVSFEEDYDIDEVWF